MVTIFTIPKAFDGHVAITQWNAINSWKMLGQDCQVIICGDDKGVAHSASEIGVEYISNIERNKYGTPLLSSAFELVKKSSRHHILCFVNADIILLSDFLRSINHIKFRDFLSVGQRWNMDLDRKLDFDDCNWETNLWSKIKNHGKIHGPKGSDYFVFPKTSRLLPIPDFAVGRPGWDCWFIYRARQLRLPVIDSTAAVRIIHQNHDYSHLNDFSDHTLDGTRWSGPETQEHLELIGGSGKDNYFTPLDATHLLTDAGVKRALDYFHLAQQWNNFGILYPKARPMLNFVNRFFKRKLKNFLGKNL